MTITLTVINHSISLSSEDWNSLFNSLGLDTNSLTVFVGENGSGSLTYDATTVTDYSDGEFSTDTSLSVDSSTQVSPNAVISSS